MSSENLAIGETTIARELFSPSPVLFWLKTEMTVTEKRITGRQPNTFAGIIPLGSEQILFPLKQVSAVGVSTTVKPVRMVFGIILFIAGLGIVGSSALPGLILALVGALMFVGGLRCALVVTNNAGVRHNVTVTLFEKSRLAAFAAKVNEHVVNL
jgi:hypothetical protein